MLVGIPLGLSSRRGGKSIGFVLTIFLVFIYYFLILDRHGAGQAGEDPSLSRGVGRECFLRGCRPAAAAADGARGRAFSCSAGFRKSFAGGRPARPSRQRKRLFASLPRRKLYEGFPLILDDYVLRSFLSSFLLVEVSFVLLSLIFSLFELLGDIVRNRAALALVGDYLLNLTPSMIYSITPLERADRGAGHHRRAESVQRIDGDEGHRHQPVPGHCADPS